MSKLWRRLAARVLPRRRTEYPDLFEQLANIQVCYDLRPATEDQLVNLWLNTLRLMEGLHTEMHGRGMDVDQITEIGKSALRNGQIKNRP